MNDECIGLFGDAKRDTLMLISLSSWRLVGQRCRDGPVRVHDCSASLHMSLMRFAHTVYTHTRPRRDDVVWLTTMMI